MNPAIWGTLLVLGFGLVLWVSVCAYKRGLAAGRREQRQIVTRAMDKLHQQGAEASAAVDYLYERTSEEVERRLGREQ